MMAEMMSDVELAYSALSSKRRLYDKLWAYYDGLQPLRYSTTRLDEVFKNLSARFTQNWCEVVVNSVLERLELRQFQVANDEAGTVTLNSWFKASELHLDADDVELCALVTGEAFVMVWEGEAGLEGYYNDSRLCHIFYEAENPRRKRFAAKWWTTDEGMLRLTLYYPERLEYYISQQKAKDVSSHKSFVPLPMVDGESGHIAGNPYGMIPIFHYRRERRAIKSELGPSVLDTQDAINKLFADMMVSSEFGAFKQRWVISQADVGVLKNAPNEIWDLPAGDGVGQGTQVGEFNETQLGNFMEQMEKLSTAIAKMTRTPQYYFFLGARADPSGEALYAMDGPLVKKVNGYIKRFSRTWEELMLFVAAEEGIGLSERPVAVYADPRTQQPLTSAQTREANVRAGLPLRTQLRQEGWTTAELAQVERDKEAELASQQAALGEALVNARRDFDGG